MIIVLDSNVKITTCDRCNKTLVYTDNDIERNFITSSSDVLDGFDEHKHITCPNCRNEVLV